MNNMSQTFCKQRGDRLLMNKIYITDERTYGQTDTEISRGCFAPIRGRRQKSSFWWYIPLHWGEGGV